MRDHKLASIAAAPRHLPGLQERRRKPADELRQLSDELDLLIADVDQGAASQAIHEAHVDRAESIAARIRAVFRGTGAAVHPPLRHIGGRAIW